VPHDGRIVSNTSLISPSARGLNQAGAKRVAQKERFPALVLRINSDHDPASGKKLARASIGSLTERKWNLG
jgi:hypothetical protein